MKYLKAFVIFGWALPLLASFYCLTGQVSCLSEKMLCSFPFLDVSQNLALASLVWLGISVILYARQTKP